MQILFITTAKIKRIFFLLLLVIAFIFIAMLLAKTIIPVGNFTTAGSLSLLDKTIVLDPGHGGYDPGVRHNNVEEKKIVLEISLRLRDYLQAAGAKVILTRETDKDFLTVPTAGPKKQQDMKNRMQIVTDANPDLFISVHANAINSSRWRGAQVFHKIEHEPSKAAAAAVQQELIRVLANTDRAIKPGDFYVLNEAECTAILVECGFISNPEEARLLSDPAYQTKVAWAIYMGLLRYCHGLM
ncbi:MAG: N-acetylmuramoyl-L-alanine amidase CwlD [Firmicutes bacterium]|nr:N-acetylmuramoyl-L-alanine amidase CwlD [Bacillota bacterium]